MQSYTFDLILDRDPTGYPDSDRLFEVFDPEGFTITPGLVAGTPHLSCSVEAESLDEALRRALGLARSAAFGVVRVELEPAALAA